MPNYVILGNYTDDGFETLSEMDPDEFLVETRETIEAHGGELKDYYLTMGQYDAILVVEFPDDESLAKAALTVLSTGNAESETLRAFTEDETREFIDHLSG